MIVSVGSVNADFVVRADEAPSGAGSLLARDLLRTSGGKAANVAVLCARLGTPAVLLACVGDDDLAAQALAGPAAAGVDTAGVRRRPGPTGYSSVVVPPDGAKTIILATNANDGWADAAAAVHDDVAGAPDGSVLAVDLEIPHEIVTAALDAARTRRFVVVLDPAPPGRCDGVPLALVDHLVPDHSEAEALTGIEIVDELSAARAAAALRERGPGAVYVKLDGGGCVVASSEGTTLVSSPDDVTVVDATGAGDAFTGALAWALHAGRPREEAARIAVAASTCAVTAYGSQESYPSRTALDAMVRRIPPTRPVRDR